jgi:membrane dipeptidase
MKRVFLSLMIITCLVADAQRYLKIHDKAIVVDTHNDILMRAVDLGVVFDQDLIGKTHSDLARWKKGELRWRSEKCFRLRQPGDG